MSVVILQYGSKIITKVKYFSAMVIFRHTLFALPFVFIGVLVAQDGIPSISKLIWILLALLGARNGANALNRLVDSDIDAANPRTAVRHIPRGILKKWEVLLFTIGCFTLFIASAFMLNPICVYLLPIPLSLFIIYSYTKRFTWLCHFVLGAAVGGAPMGGWLAVKGQLIFPEIITPFIFWAVVALWVAGFDIIYGTLDYEFDTRHGIHSVPARFGIKGALKISALCHLAAVILLCIVPLFYTMGWAYYTAVAIVAAMLIYEHRIVSPENLTNVKIASYNVNELVGIVILIGVFIDVIFG
jgi:4-hydroxybenzoate polyprenyltransferase